MLRRLALVFSFICCLIEADSQVQWPAITRQTRPWTRWWWEGSAVNKKDLSWNLEQYRKAGLGGVEITPIYGIYGYEDQFIPFLSSKWMQMLDHTLAEAKRLDLGVDLANATGWPFGGPWVTDGDASKTIYYKTFSVAGGARLGEPVIYRQEAMVRTANNKQASIDSILSPVSANKNLQSLALDQIVYAGILPLQALVAYSDKGSVLDLTNKVDHNGKLSWTAPEGQWTLYALFIGLHGKMVERAAPGGEGYAIDHFSAAAAKNYFRKFDEAFKGHDLSYLRAFFNDSYEVDDARGQANWTPGFFTEFQRRRGYDLLKYLPALFGKDSVEKNSRVLYDYRATIDELLLEHFTEEWKKWGASKSALVRNQSHGSPANTLDLYSAVDIPETEGTDILRFKFASSAANVTGKPLVSSESATWLNEHFLSSWGDVKKAIDLYFLGGVNHIFYHGSAYSPKDAPWPGWLFYAAVHFQQVNPQWKDFGTLNAYIARVQSFLQKGRPDNDILLYYPIVDRYSEPGRDLLQHFDGMERNFEGTNFEHLSRWMMEQGYSFDFFSDRQLQKITAGNNQLVSGGNQYKTILLPANKLLPEQSMNKLVELARQGATILVYKSLPADVPGMGQLDKRRAIFNQLKAGIHFTTEGNLEKAKVGKGYFYCSEDMDALLQAAGARKETLVAKRLSSTRRRSSDGYTYFINNRTDTAIDEWVSLVSPAVSVAVFDPMTGMSGLAQWKSNSSKGFDVHLQVPAHGSLIVQAYLSKRSGPAFPYVKATGSPVELTGSWDLEFLNGGPAIPPKTTVSSLGSWTNLPGDEVKNFAGTAKYTLRFAAPALQVKAWLLDLGKVNETAEVFLNGRKISTLIGPVFQVVIPAGNLAKDNKIEIIVASLMANRIAYMDRNNLPWKIFYNTNMPARKRENTKNGLFDASAWQPFPSGLSGPVTLTPLRYE